MELTWPKLLMTERREDPCSGCMTAEQRWYLCAGIAQEVQARCIGVVPMESTLMTFVVVRHHLLVQGDVPYLLVV